MKRVAATIHPRVRHYIELEELIALGNEGLAEAATRYDPDKGATFSTFAWYRVHGAIIDGLRRATQLPRRTWAKLVALRAAGDYLEHRGERDRGASRRGAAPPQGAEALASIRDAMSAIRTMYVTSLEALREHKKFDPAADAPAVADQLHTTRIAARLRAALDALPDKERELLTKHYWEGKNLLEAGTELGISKSWASRLHAQAIERLRELVESGPDP